MKSDLELALECVINIYHEYAMRWPIDDYLSKYEFSQLLKEHAQPFLFNTKQPNSTLDDYIHDLFIEADCNHDGRLKFTEFLKTLAAIFIDAHNRSHQHLRGGDEHPGAGHGHDHGHDHGK